MKITQYIKRPCRIVFFLSNRGLLNWMGDKTYLKLRYRALIGKKLNLKNPDTYTAKLQWLKLYDHQPRYTALVDKYEVKDYVRKTIGAEYLIPDYGVWNCFDDIPFQDLPEEFVLKCTHDSGGLLICRDKSTLDLSAARKKMETARQRSFYKLNREWTYKHIPPRIIAEQYMENSKTGDLRDYKFFCFDGVPKLMFVATDRQTPGEDTKFDFFDMDYRHLELINGHPNAKTPPEKPRNFELMKELAAKLSKDIPHVRVDFYEVDGRVYFGEMTFYHFSGTVRFEPDCWDKTLGDWITLPPKQV